MRKITLVFIFGLLLLFEFGFLNINKRFKKYKKISESLLIICLLILVVLRYQKLDRHTLKTLPSILKNNQIYKLYKTIDDLFSRFQLSDSVTPSIKSNRKLSQAMKKMVAAQQKWICGYCGQVLKASFEVDHVIPLFKGGTNQRNNLLAVCRNCHGEKTLFERLNA